MKNLVNRRRVDPPISYNEEVTILYLLGRTRRLRERLCYGYWVYLHDRHVLHEDFIDLSRRLGFDRGALDRLLTPAKRKEFERTF